MDGHAFPGTRRFGVALVAAVSAVGLFGLWGPVLLGGAAGDRVRPTAVVLVLVQAGVLWWRQRFPLMVLGVALAAVLVAEALGDENAASFVGAHVAAYTAGLIVDRVVPVLGIIALAALAEAALTGLGAGQAAGAVLLGPTGLLLGIAWGIGRYARIRRAYVNTLLAYAQRLERERDEQARSAVAEERRRIARELHDQVAHHLGVVSLQTGAARQWVARDPERAAAAMRSVEEAARSALNTMPMILHSLRTGPGDELLPQPGLHDLAALIERVTDAGLSVELTFAGGQRALDTAVEASAYRIVQEGLTNVLKHAGAARAQVTVTFGASELIVEVNDDGEGTVTTRGQSGFGLLGIRERVELLGGLLETGEGSDGGFMLRARLPLSPDRRPV